MHVASPFANFVIVTSRCTQLELMCFRPPHAPDWYYTFPSVVDNRITLDNGHYGLGNTVRERLYL